MRVIVAVMAAALVAGCSGSPGAQPWERGNLAKPQMGLEPDPADARFTQHIYTSKESASGGYGVGGGGCGCN